MSYEKQVWSKYDDLKPEEENIENGAVVTDNRMNHIEEGIEDNSNAVENHVANMSNPHLVTKTQIGLGNVDNVQQAAKTDFDAHVANTSNPHGVTKDQIGLDKVANVEQASKSNFDAHVANTSNPHAVTASQVNAYEKTVTFTKTEIQNLISSVIAQSKLDSNPIGTIITTTSIANPTDYIGGTWQRFAQGRTLVGVDETDDVTLMKSANNMGGSINPLTKHSHNIRRAQGTAQSYVGAAINYSNLPDQQGVIHEAGDNNNHNNWQPFVTVYYWKRTA